jgi:hypothetical protein
MTTTVFERITAKLEKVKITHNGTQARAKCPAHAGDSDTSLAIRRVEGKTLVHCFADCQIEDILASLEMSKADLYDDSNGYTYSYPDGAYVHRSYTRDGKKKFYQSGNTGGGGAATTLYRLDAVNAAKLAGKTIWFPEGEDDVHALESIGQIATTSRGGAGNVHKCDLTPLHGANVVVVVDKDAAGEKRARTISNMLSGKAKLAWVQGKVGKDASEHVGAELGVSDFDPYTFSEDGENAANEPPQRHLKVVPASEIGMEATCWLWEDQHGKWIPEAAVTLLAGREGVGKSTIEADIVANITNGKLPGEHFGTPKSVIICATEDSWRQTINPRLVAAGADLDRVFRVDAYTPEGFDGTLQLPEDIERVREIVADHDVVLIVLDPLMSELSVKLDTHKDAEVRRGLEPLSRLAHTANLSVIGLIHENKSSASDLLSRIMGSRAFTAVVRAVLYAARRDEEDDEFVTVGTPQFVLGQIKSNLGRKVPHAMRYHIDGVIVGYDPKKQKDIWSSHIVWETMEDQSVEDIVKNQEAVKRDQTITEVKAWLKKYLQDKGEVPSETVLKAGEAIGYSRSTVQRARGALKVRVVPIGRSTTWSLLSSS